MLSLTPSSEDRKWACGVSKALFTKPAPNHSQPFSSVLSVTDHKTMNSCRRAPDNAGHLMWLNITARAFLFPNQSVELWGLECVSQPFAILWKTKKRLMP